MSGAGFGPKAAALMLIYSLKIEDFSSANYTTGVKSEQAVNLNVISVGARRGNTGPPYVLP